MGGYRHKKTGDLVHGDVAIPFQSSEMVLPSGQVVRAGDFLFFEDGRPVRAIPREEFLADYDPEDDAARQHMELIRRMKF